MQGYNKILYEEASLIKLEKIIAKMHNLACSIKAIKLIKKAWMVNKYNYQDTLRALIRVE